MSIRNQPARAWVRAGTLSFAAATLLTSASCSKHDASPKESAAAADVPTTASGAPMTPVRGTITAVSDTALTVTTPTGARQIHVVAPLHVYTRKASDLAHVTPNAFVGITSVAQMDGSQRATEIHIFPEELRGTGEGSRMMEQNGSVSPSRMTNGSVSGSRMTNGSVAPTADGTSYTVRYQGGTQTIEVPAGVTVTAIAPTQTKLAAGANVVVLARTGADGRLSASAILLSGSNPPK